MKTRLQIVTLNLPQLFVEALDNLVKNGLYPSRSEAIRVAVRDFLKVELVLTDVLIAIEPKNDQKQSKQPQQKGIKIDMRKCQSGWEGNKIVIT